MKRILCLLVSVIMLFGCICVNAAQQDTRFGVLKAFGIMEGYGGGDLGLDRLVTRAEFTKMAIAASKYANSVTGTLSVSPFPDVTYDKWFAPYVYLGVSNGLLAGYKDGTFKPDNHVLYEEGVAILLRLLGYQDSEFAYSWPTGQIGMAERIGLDAGMSAYAGQALTRDQVAHLFYNLLSADTKDGMDYTATTDRQLLQDITISSSYKQSKSIKKGFVVTSEGTYEVSEDFDYSLVGSKGDAVIKNKKITEFIPKSQQKETYYVYSVIGNDIILYKDGNMSDMKLSINEKIYFDGVESTVSSILSKLESGDSIDVFYDDGGDILHLIHGDSTLEGPYTVSGIPSYINSDTQIMRKGTQVSAGEIENGDILYYSKTLNMAWVYCDKVTGVYESASPNQDTPTSVTVSGKVYEIEGVTAYKALASNGDVAYGDTVTLLLGKDGKIAGVQSELLYENCIGYMISGGSKEYTDSLGKTYTSPYVNLLMSDGIVQEFKSVKNYSDYYKDCVVGLTFEGEKVVLEAMEKNTVEGEFSYGLKLLGKYKINKNIKLYDVVDGEGKPEALYAKIFPQRIDGLTFTKDEIKYVEFNSDGEIITIFFNDATGDSYSYGLLISSAESAKGFNVMGSYTYFDKSQKKSISTSGTTFSIKVSSAVPIQIRNTSAGVAEMTKLENLGKVTDLTSTAVRVSGKSYKYLSDMTIYYHDGNEYQAITHDKFEEMAEGKTATAYSEKTDVSSARVRVIVVK